MYLTGGIHYIDIFTFHVYSFGNTSWTKSDVVTEPFTGVNSWNQKLTQIQNWLASIPGGHGDSYGKLAVTEFNITYKNDPNGDDLQNSTIDNPVDGIACNSFIAGQYFAEMLAVGHFHQQWWYNFVMMLAFSVEESANQDFWDLGLLDQTSSTTPFSAPYSRRSTFQHYRFMAREFQLGRVQFLNNAPNYGDFKAFAIRSCTGSAIVVMNQNPQGTNPLSYYFNFDNSLSTPPNFDITGLIDTEWKDRFVTSDIAFMPNALGSIDPMETHVIVLDACGNIIRRYEYNEVMNQAAYSDPIENSYQTVCSCSLTTTRGEWYDRGDSPYRIADPSTGVEENTAFTQLKAYPNPSNGKTTFAGSFANGSKGDITIYSISGVLVKTIEVSGPQFKQEVDLEDLKSGIYFYTLRGESGEITTSKLAILK